MARKSDDRGGSKGPGSQRDPRDVRIERLERDKAKLIEERDHWKRRSEHLEKELEAARRAGRRQAAPFAKDRPQGRGGRPGRRAGAEREAWAPTAAAGDETHVAPAPTSCPDCGGAVALDRVASLTCPRCVPSCGASTSRWATARSVSGACRAGTPCRPPTRWARLPLNWARTSPRWVVELHTELGMPLEKVVRVLRTQFGLSVTKGGLSNCCTAPPTRRRPRMRRCASRSAAVRWSRRMRPAGG